MVLPRLAQSFGLGVRYSPRRLHPPPSSERAEGAPFEWINPQTNQYSNPHYCASATVPLAVFERS